MGCLICQPTLSQSPPIWMLRLAGIFAPELAHNSRGEKLGKRGALCLDAQCQLHKPWLTKPWTRSIRPEISKAGLECMLTIGLIWYRVLKRWLKWPDGHKSVEREHCCLCTWVQGNLFIILNWIFDTQIAVTNGIQPSLSHPTYMHGRIYASNLSCCASRAFVPALQCLCWTQHGLMILLFGVNSCGELLDPILCLIKLWLV